MVGMIDPNPTPPKQQPERQSQSRENWWKGIVTNPIQVKRPAQGKYSPKADERCFTWCSQTVRGRTEGQDPWCRSICIRRVFEHEVRQLTSHFSHDAAHHSRLVSSSSPSTDRDQERDRKGAALKYPLPPEGQRRLFGNDNDDDDYDGDDDNSQDTRGYIYNNNNSYNNAIEKGKGKEVKYWEEGWYVWMTKNRWAAQEKMDLMMLDLEKQTNWNKVKEQEERAWAESQAQAQALEKMFDKEIEGREGREGRGNVLDGLDAETQFSVVPVRHPYPNAAEESFLIRLPTRLDFTSYAQQTLSPTYKLLTIVRKSFESGDQRELGRRAWGVVRDGTPFRLVRNVVRICLDGLGRGKGGGGGTKGEDS